MKDFHCSDTGKKCDFIARADKDDDVISQVRAHAQNAHQLEVTPDLEKQVLGLIHDEAGEKHRQSMMKH